MADRFNRLWCSRSGGFGSRNGQAAIFGALTLALMFSAVGLAVDLGWGYFLKQRVQTAADAAASAATVYALNNNDTCAILTCGVALNCTGVTAPPTSSLTSGCLFATADGPPVLTASMVEDKGSNLPAGLSGVSPSMWVKATVTASSSNSFLSLAGFGTSSISASAVGGVFTAPPASCIYVLDPSASDAMQVKGTASISTNCPVYINSSDSSALRKTGAGDINAVVDIVGNFSKVGSGKITPPPSTGKTPVADPFASLPAPSFSGCDQTNYSTSTTVTLSPGVYCGGISIMGSGTVTLKPGIYIMNGGGLSLAGSADLTGSHVMIYNTATPTRTIGAISIAGSGTLTLSAPNSGTYEGILIFQDRTQSIGGSVNGSNTSVVTGTIYLPDANITYTGTTSAQYTALVADTVTMVGTSSFKSDTNGTYTGLSISRAGLLQ